MRRAIRIDDHLKTHKNASAVRKRYKTSSEPRKRYNRARYRLPVMVENGAHLAGVPLDPHSRRLILAVATLRPTSADENGF